MKDLNLNGRLILNQKNLEKVRLYLEISKVLKAAGVREEHVENAKSEKRKMRKYFSKNSKMRIIKDEIEKED